jgi:hypothetical protein
MGGMASSFGKGKGKSTSLSCLALYLYLTPVRLNQPSTDIESQPDSGDLAVLSEPEVRFEQPLLILRGDPWPRILYLYFNAMFLILRPQLYASSRRGELGSIGEEVLDYLRYSFLVSSDQR